MIDGQKNVTLLGYSSALCKVEQYKIEMNQPVIFINCFVWVWFYFYQLFRCKQLHARLKSYHNDEKK